MKKTISISVLAFAVISAMAQPMTYDRYYNLIAEKNILYISERYNIDKATASVQAARVFNDPELSVAYGNNQDWDLQMGQSIEVEMSINPDFSGVRRARIAVAQNEKDITEASVSAYLSDLRLEAARVWAEAWRLRKNYAVLEESVNGMIQIARSDSLRFSVGDIGRSDALQSRLEAQTMKGELLKMWAEYINALDAVSLLCGGEPVSSLEGELPDIGLIPAESEIVALAESNRADLKAAILSKTLSENNLKLLRASRAFEMGINLGYSYNSEVRNEIAPAPRFNGLSVGITIPLKFSSLNKGEINAAQSEILQSEHYLEAARQKVRSEVTQAYNSLMAANAVKSQYNESILEDAHNILDSRKKGYLKGESSLMELLSAQQTYLDIMQAYTEACCNSFVCKAQLEQAAGCSF